jgi:FG-GAP repeat
MSARVNATCLLCLLALASAMPAQQPILQVPTSFPWETDPVVADLLGDVTGDGVPDVIVGEGSFFDDEFGGWQPGRFTGRSGADGALLYAVDGQAPKEGLGQALTAMGDVNGDGLGDALVIAVSAAHLVSGVDGAELRRITEATSYLFAMVARMPDIDGDGIDDAVIGTPQDEGAGAGGAVRVHSGRDGSVLVLVSGQDALESWGTAVAAPGDVDDDGFCDFAFTVSVADASQPRRVRMHSGRTGALLFELLGGPQPSGLYSDLFGRALGAASDIDLDGRPDLLLGMWVDTSPEGLGIVRVHSGATGGLVLGLTPSEAPGQVGTSLAGTGDLDLDGWPDLAASAKSYANSGACRLFSGVDGVERSRILASDVEGTSWDFGMDMRVVPDVDADGQSDILIAAADSIVLMPGVLPRRVAAWHSWNGTEPDAQFGAAVAEAGDADGDGFGDMIVGSPGPTSLFGLAGAVQLFSGKDGALLWTRNGEATDRLGAAVAAAGDVDGDGLSDVLAGAPGPIGSAVSPGRLLLLSGADGSLLDEWQGSTLGDHFGAAVAEAADLDGDGVTDVAVGAPQHDGAQSGSGAITIFSGATGLQLGQLASATGNAYLGASLDVLGDLDGDGLVDVAVGAPNEKIPGSGFLVSAGTVRVVDHHAQVLLKIEAPKLNTAFGSIVVGAGDLDGDGTPEMAVLSPIEQTDLPEKFGAVRVYSGATALNTIDAADLGGTLAMTLAGGLDLDGDGGSDLVVATMESEASLPQAFVCGMAGRVPAISVTADTFGEGPSTQLALSDIDANGVAELIWGAAEPIEGAGHVAVRTHTASWLPLAPGLAGYAGVPTLTADGVPSAGIQVALTLDAAAAGAPVRLFAGLSKLGAPFHGGILVPAIDVVVPGVTDETGSVSWSGTWPAGLPAGSELFFQCWILDAAAPKGLAASHALKATLP